MPNRYGPSVDNEPSYSVSQLGLVSGIFSSIPQQPDKMGIIIISPNIQMGTMRLSYAKWDQICRGGCPGRMPRPVWCPHSYSQPLILVLITHKSQASCWHRQRATRRGPRGTETQRSWEAQFVPGFGTSEEAIRQRRDTPCRALTWHQCSHTPRSVRDWKKWYTLPWCGCEMAHLSISAPLPFWIHS